METMYGLCVCVYTVYYTHNPPIASVQTKGTAPMICSVSKTVINPSYNNITNRAIYFQMRFTETKYLQIRFTVTKLPFEKCFNIFSNEIYCN